MWPAGQGAQGAQRATEGRQNLLTPCPRPAPTTCRRPSRSNKATPNHLNPQRPTTPQEIVMYAYFKRLDYFSTECVYAPFAARGFARDLVKDLEVRSAAVL